MFSPISGSRDILVSLSGNSLFSVTGVFLTSGTTGAQATLVSTSTNLITFYPPSVAPSGITSGKWQIFNLFGNSTESNYFYYLPPVFISGFQPQSGFTGSAVTFSGSGLQNVSGILFGDQLGTFATPILQNETYIVTGFVPFYSGGLSKFIDITIFSPGGSSTLGSFYVMERGISLSGLNGFPTPYIAENYIRINTDASALEYRTPNQVLNDITGVLKSGGDYLTGDYYITGGKLNVTGISIQSTGMNATGIMLIDTVLRGGYLIMRSRVGGIEIIESTLAYS